MKLRSITLRNYRNFEEYSLDLGRKITILIGRNGMGKTNLINSMVHVLSFVFSKQRNLPQSDFIRSSDQGVKHFAATDARFTNDYQYPISLRAKAELNGEESLSPLDWELVQESKTSGLRDSLFRVAYRRFWDYYNAIGEKPVFAFFSDGFPHKDTRLSKSMRDRLISGNALPANTGYYQWDEDQSCVEIWKRYYAQQWMNNRLSPSDEKQAYVDSVKNALCGFSSPIEGGPSNEDMVVEDLSARMFDDKVQLMIKLAGNDNDIPFNSLPQGYNRLFSMVLDLASRSFLLNGNCNPEGIVIIDEIELHLHPAIAINVLQRLSRSFDRMQFIVSTHSPLVITNFNQAGNTEDNKLYQLTYEDGEYSKKVIRDVFGLSYDGGLNYVMLAENRNREMGKIKDLYLYWKEHNPEKAEMIAKTIREKFAHNSSFLNELGL